MHKTLSSYLIRAKIMRDTQRPLVHLNEELHERRARTGSKTCTSSHTICDTGDAHARKTNVKREVNCPACKAAIKERKRK
jgi:hypothetical protein